MGFWAKALKKSPLSDSSREFRNHVTHFLKEEGKSVWGRRFDSIEAVETFLSLIKK